MLLWPKEEEQVPLSRTIQDYLSYALYMQGSVSPLNAVPKLEFEVNQNLQKRDFQLLDIVHEIQME